MVSEVEPEARPSYQDVSEHLIHLSDDEDDKSGEDAVSSPDAGSNSARGQNAGQSLSSGDSSEDQPDQAGVVRYHETPKEDHVSEADELDPQLYTLNEAALLVPSQDVKVNFPDNHFVLPRRSAAGAIPQIDSINLPAPYRALIKESATRLTVPRAPRVDDGRERVRNPQKARLAGSHEYPFGPVTPFGTRLKAPPPRRGRVEVVVVNEPDDHEERRRKRQRRAYHVGRFVPLLAPWQVWEGEGWWPEMLASHARPGTEQTKFKSKGKGKGKEREEEFERAGWTMREDVRIGLDDVGRTSVDSLTILGEA